MRLYQFLLPTVQNNGHSYPSGALARFEHTAELLCGGFTVFPSVGGVWVDSKTDHRYYDESIPIQVAVPNEDGDNILRALITQFQDSFPDQKSIMVTDMGEVTFYGD